MLKVYHIRMRNKVFNTSAAETTLLVLDFGGNVLPLPKDPGPPTPIFDKLTSVSDPFSISKGTYFSSRFLSPCMESTSGESPPFCILPLFKGRKKKRKKHWSVLLLGFFISNSLAKQKQPKIGVFYASDWQSKCTMPYSLHQPEKWRLVCTMNEFDSCVTWLASGSKTLSTIS